MARGKQVWKDNPNFESIKGRVTDGGRCERFCPHMKFYIGSFSCQNECSYSRGTTFTPGYATVKCAWKAAHKKDHSEVKP